MADKYVEHPELMETMRARVQDGEWICYEEGSKEGEHSQGPTITLDASTFQEDTIVVVKEPA